MKEEIRSKVMNGFVVWLMIVSTVLMPLAGLIFLGSSSAKAEHAMDGDTVAFRWHISINFQHVEQYILERFKYLYRN